MRGYLLTFAVFLAFSASPAAAQVPTTAPLPRSTAPAAAPADSDPTGNPYSPKVNAMARVLAHELSDSQVEALAEIRTNFGDIRAIRLAESDVGHAIETCTKANPDMAAPLNTRFGSWQQALTPLMTQDQNDLEQTIRSGIAGDHKKIEAYLNMIDKSAAYADSQVDKRSATSPAACHALLDSLDRTQGELVKVLSTLKWPQEPNLAGPDSAKPAGK